MKLVKKSMVVVLLLLSSQCQLLHAADFKAQSEAQSNVYSYGLEQSVSETHMDGELVFTDLSDQVHVLQQIPKSATAVHYYSFTAVRGQMVLLAHSGDGQRAAFKVEYLTGDKWEELVGDSRIFSGLGANGSVIVRVMSKIDVPRTSAAYRLILGSYPVLKKYELHDEVGVNRIPTGHTQPSWFWTQGYTQANLEAYFTDSVGAPLKGAVGRFTLGLSESRLKPVVEEVVSNHQGKVKTSITFGRCTGGHEALDHVTYHLGTHTWRSYYYVGGYTFSNALLGPAADADAAQDLRLFGHICRQQLIKTARGSI